MIFSLAACKKDWSEHFDLSDEKIYWDETLFDDSWYTTLDPQTIIIIFKKTETYPRLCLRDLKLKNIKILVYSNLNPNEGSLALGESWRQEAQIALKKSGKEKTIEAIRHLEKLEFVKSAYPYVGIPVPLPVPL